jgi:ribonucleoside-diphosphate reductase alpha chain
MNAGSSLGVPAGCFVLPVADSLRSIFATLRTAALVHQAGAGTGFSFSAVRPQGDVVASSGGSASGPMSFIRVYDTATGVIHRGGWRHTANMAVLDVSHPDIESFVVGSWRADLNRTRSGLASAPGRRKRPPGR